MTYNNLRLPIADCRFKNLRLSAFICGLMLLAFPVIAQNKITASIVITNSTANGLTFTVNGSTRTWTNNVFNSATMVLTNADVTGCGSKTNLLNQIRATPFVQVTSSDTGSNSFNLVGNANLAMAVSVSGTYATISYSTQTVAQVIALQGPVSALPTAVARTNVASDIVGAAAAPENTNSIPQTSKAASELVGTNGTQTIPGVKTFSNSNSIWNGFVSQLLDVANVLRGGYWSNGVAEGVTLSNAPAISGTVQWMRGGVISNVTMIWGTSGTNAMITSSGLAQFNLAIAIQAFGGTKFNFGDVGLNGDLQFYAQTNGSSTPLLLYNANPTNMNFLVPIIFSSSVSISGSNTIGGDLAAGGNVSAASNLTVVANETIMGNFTPKGLTTNQTWTGTNNFPPGADIAFGRSIISSLINGVNAAVPIGTNKVAQVSGPTGAFSIDGIANGRDGKEIVLFNRTGFNMTIANESGSDPVPANRIQTGLSGNLVMTNIPSIVGFWYDSAAGKWLVTFHN